MSKDLEFKLSGLCSIGVEIELQIINPYTYELIERVGDILENLKKIPHTGKIKPEITQGMLELNTSVHDNIQNLYVELTEIKAFLVDQAKILGIRLSGGGTHPLHRWQDSTIFPAPRYRRLSKFFDYLAKQCTIFGQHIHIGCPSGDEAIYLTHALSHYLSFFIALSAASPCYEGVETPYNCTRLNTTPSLPTNICIPYVKNWHEFCLYYEKMHQYKIVESMKDFYWDIRPKPEFGTVELRICDTPLTIETSAMLAAYAQTLSLYLLEKRPIKITHDMYLLYHYNRFQACRFGLEADYINASTGKQGKIHQAILENIEEILPYTKKLGNEEFIEQMVTKVMAKQNDSKWIHATYKKLNSFPELILEQSKQWMGD